MNRDLIRGTSNRVMDNGELINRNNKNPGVMADYQGK